MVVFCPFWPLGPSDRKMSARRPLLKFNFTYYCFSQHCCRTYWERLHPLLVPFFPDPYVVKCPNRNLLWGSAFGRPPITHHEIALNHQARSIDTSNRVNNACTHTMLKAKIQATLSSSISSYWSSCFAAAAARLSLQIGVTKMQMTTAIYIL